MGEEEVGLTQGTGSTCEGKGGDSIGHSRAGNKELLVSVQFCYGKWPIPLGVCKGQYLA